MESRTESKTDRLCLRTRVCPIVKSLATEIPVIVPVQGLIFLLRELAVDWRYTNSSMRIVRLFSASISVAPVAVAPLTLGTEAV